jgi:hypothetical protein
MDAITDFFAKRAGEEFFRSGRAPTDAARAEHRRRGERYSNLVLAVRRSTKDRAPRARS